MKISLLAGACAGAVLCLGTYGHAAVLLMDFTNIHPPIVGVAAYDGSKFTSPAPVDDFTAADGVIPSTVFHNAVFNIRTGFNVTSTIISETGNFGVADTGETVISTLSGGTFDFTSPAGLLVSGTFDGATMTSTVGASGATITTSNTNHLVLTPGSALTSSFPGLSFANPESLTIGLTGVPGAGVQVSSVTQPYGPAVPILSGHLDPFGVTSGSINMSAAFSVPEPASLSVLTVGALGLMARRRRDR